MPDTLKVVTRRFNNRLDYEKLKEIIRKIFLPDFRAIAGGVTFRANALLNKTRACGRYIFNSGHKRPNGILFTSMLFNYSEWWVFHRTRVSSSDAWVYDNLKKKLYFLLSPPFRWVYEPRTRPEFVHFWTSEIIYFSYKLFSFLYILFVHISTGNITTPHKAEVTFDYVTYKCRKCLEFF